MLIGMFGIGPVELIMALGVLALVVVVIALARRKG
jgi:hypothetical protein